MNRPHHLPAARRAALACLLLLRPDAALPQQPAVAQPQGIVATNTVQVVAGARYRAGPLHRFLFGAGWRDLWTTPIEVPVLDLARTAGGLRPVTRGGGFQTRSLELVGAGGREFRFRSVDKDPSQTLPPRIRWPGIVRLMRDQTSALHPGSALAAASLARTAGLPHLPPHVVILPDDPALGSFRREFGGMLGVLEERPAPTTGTAGLFGFRDVADTDTLLTRLGTEPGSRVDAPQYLAARLVDFYLNDWDRHKGNWLWGTRDAAAPRRWLAIPKDRDQAFASYEGLVLAFVRVFVPKLLPFTGDYRLRGLTVNARALDRQILTALDPPVCDSVAQVLVGRLSDAAVDSALRRMPEPYYRLSEAELAETLRQRRDRLPAAARAWCGRLAGGADPP